MSNEPKHDVADFDVIIPRGPIKETGMDVLRVRPEGVTHGRFLPVQEGKPLQPGAEMVAVKPRPNLPIFDVKTVYKPESADSRSGPPKVVSDAYRDGWDAIFGGKTDPNEAN